MFSSKTLKKKNISKCPAVRAKILTYHILDLFEAKQNQRKQVLGFRTLEIDPWSFKVE